MRLVKTLAIFSIPFSLLLTSCALKLPPKPADGAPRTYPQKYPKPE